MTSCPSRASVGDRRDAAAAAEDLQLLLDAQQLKDGPAGVLCFTCNGRGTRLFPEPHHDAATLRDRLSHAPLAGFFAGGEIGPIGGRSFLHGHTLSAAVFRTMPAADGGARG